MGRGRPREAQTEAPPEVTGAERLRLPHGDVTDDSRVAPPRVDDGARPLSRLGDVVLQGTFETLALPELLSLLGHSGKTGALWLEAGASSAVVYLQDGRCCSAASSDAADAVADGAALMSRLVEVCFSVARADDGSFRFGTDAPPWKCEQTVDVDIAIDELGRLVDEWREIQSVIPSLECRVRLSEQLAVEELTVDQARWQLLISIDGRRTVRDLVRKTSRPVLEICHEIVALVDAGACTVSLPPAAGGTVRSTGGGKATRAVVDPETPWGPGVESPHPGPAGGPVDEELAPARGSYLRVFTGTENG